MDDFERRAVERRHRARQRQRWESRAYFVGFAVAFMATFAITDSWWLRIPVSVVAGAVIGGVVKALFR